MAEKEYIEREALEEIINKLSNEPEYWHTGETFYAGVSAVDLEILTIPTADVAEIIYCRSCKHRDKKGVCEKFRQRYPFFPEDNFYCGFGERRKV